MPTTTSPSPVYVIADAVDPTDSLLYGFDPVTGAVRGVAASPLRPTSSVSNIALARRPSDGHLFVGGGTGWVYEWNSDLVGIGQYGTPDPSAPNALQPSNTIWTLNGIQFLGNDVWLFWSGGGFTTGNIVAQRRDPITFALRDSFTIDNSLLPVNNAAGSIAYGLNQAATVLFLRSTGGGVAGQNNIYAYTIATNTVASWGSYGIWTPPTTGWFVREFRVLSDDRIVALYLHATAGVVDNAHLVVFAPDGSIALDFAPEDSSSNLSVTHLGVVGDVSIWTAQDYYDAGLDSNVTTFRNYAINDGSKIGQFTPPQQDALSFIVQAPSPLPAMIGTVTIDCGRNYVTITGVNFSVGAAIDVQDPNGNPVTFTLISFSATQIVLQIAYTIPGTYKVTVTNP